jgi:Arm DNA-binding domain
MGPAGKHLGSTPPRIGARSMKLTQTNIHRLCVLSAGERDKIFFDDEVSGFGLRVREGGSRKWVVHYRQGGIQRRHTIGAASVLTVEEARRKARKVLVDVDDGKDPAADKVAKRTAAGLIFSSVMGDYLAARQSDMKPRSHQECSTSSSTGSHSTVSPSPA